MSDETPCYVSICPVCGGVLYAAVAASVPPQTAQLVPKWTVNAVRQAPWGHLADCERAS